MRTRDVLRWSVLTLAGLLVAACTSAPGGGVSLQRDAGPLGVEASLRDGPSARDANEAPVNGRDGSAAESASTWKPAPHLAWPAIPNHGGPMLDPLRIVTVVAEDDPHASDLKAFGDAIPGSSWLASFASEYGLTGTPTHVQILGSHVATGTSFTQAQMKQYIADTIAAASPSPTPDGHTVYALFLPPGTNLVINGQPDTACAAIPYRGPYDALGDGMAILPRCQYTFPSQLVMFTTDGAHEIMEAATDPEPVTNPGWELWTQNAYKPWKSSVWNEIEMIDSLEIGDPCILTRILESGINFQRIFSNTALAAGGDPCVPKLPIPYFSVTVAPSTGGWFKVTAGEHLDVPLTGWSTGATDDWVVWAARGSDDVGDTFPATIQSATTQTVDAHVYATSNNGRPLTLQVRIPNDAQSGWWAAFDVWSWHTDSTGAYLAGEDFGHESVVGLYAP
jgi:hypothetical protein